MFTIAQDHELFGKNTLHHKAITVYYGSNINEVNNEPISSRKVIKLKDTKHQLNETQFTFITNEYIEIYNFDEIFIVKTNGMLNQIQDRKSKYIIDHYFFQLCVMILVNILRIWT